MIIWISFPTIVCMFHCPCASVVELVPGIARHVIMSRHTCISVCIIKHILKQQQQKNKHPSASVTSATVSPLMGGHSWDPLHGGGAPENAKWGTGVHNAICGVPPLFPHIQWHFCVPHRTGVSATQCQTWINNYQVYIQQTLLTTSNPLFFWPMTFCLPCYITVL